MQVEESADRNMQAVLASVVVKAYLLLHQSANAAKMQCERVCVAKVLPNWQLSFRKVVITKRVSRELRNLWMEEKQPLSLCLRLINKVRRLLLNLQHAE